MTDRILIKEHLAAEGIWRAITFEVAPNGARTVLDILHQNTEAEINDLIWDLYGIHPGAAEEETAFTGERFALRDDVRPRPEDAFPFSEGFSVASSFGKAAQPLLQRATWPARISRSEILEMKNSDNESTSKIIAYALGWGGMRKNFLDLLIQQQDKTWIEVAQNIRDGQMSRTAAYREFTNLRRENKLKGMGPAYFTKIIYFLTPDRMNPGLIMDQWTGCGINILVNEQVVLMDTTSTWFKKNEGSPVLKHGYTVSDCNSAGNYERFCAAIEQLARDIGVKRADEAEAALFGRGGHHPSAWRKHVIKERRPDTPVGGSSSALKDR